MLKHYFKKSWVSRDQILLPGTDLAVTRGYALFDYLRTYDQVPFHLDEHIERLFRTASIINLQPPFSRDEIIAIVREGIVKNAPHSRELDVKIVVTGGDSLDGISVQEGAQNFYVLFGSITPHDEIYFATPRKLITRPSTRIFTDAKSSVYLGPLVYRAAAKAAGAVEILNVSHAGIISECMRANIFFCADDEVIVPTDDILLGITRQVIISQLKQAGTKVTERTVRKEEISSMRGAWISGSGIEIVPIQQIDEVVLGDGSIPTLTKKAIELFRVYTRDYPTRAEH